MPDDRRYFTPGAMCFFTVNLKNRKSDLLVTRIDDLREAWRRTQKDWPFETIAFCILPDHLHCVLKLPKGDYNFPVRWMRIKTCFTRTIPKQDDPASATGPRERGIWQRRYWDHMIRDEEDLENHVNYIHYNPVKHGLVDDPDDWPYSTWHRFKRGFGRSRIPNVSMTDECDTF
ncbi:REP-associated tyrosine transposase [Ponticaulis koreensis]|uniref:REP-associated tyrosine transposase n=1 Tax=Ponticaulis koreensis TaxID=1123045 RepID=UPI0003B62CAC|nr:transposase [Ponticaulis koreensis]